MPRSTDHWRFGTLTMSAEQYQAWRRSWSEEARQYKPQRDAKGRWISRGSHPSVAGQVSGTKYFKSQLLRQLAMKYDDVEAIAMDASRSTGERMAAKSVLRALEDGDGSAALRDLQFIADRVDGKAAQGIELETKGDMRSPQELLRQAQVIIGVQTQRAIDVDDNLGGDDDADDASAEG